MNRRMIPFTVSALPDLESMMSTAQEKVRGLIGLADGMVVLQFQVTRSDTDPSTMEVRKESTEPVELVIPFDDLASVKGRGRWGRTVTLIANDLNTFNRIPGNKGERIDLSFARADRADVDAWVAELGEALSDLGLERLDHRIRELEGGSS